MALFDVVFEGGGAKGSAFAGALTALKERGHSTRRLVGTSAGAITATLAAAGYTPAEMLAAVNEKVDGKPRFAGFMDKPKAADFNDDIRQNSDTVEALKQVHVPAFIDRDLLSLLLASPLYAQLFCFAECGGLFQGDNFRGWLTEKLAAKGIAAGGTLATMFAKTNVDLSVVTSDTTQKELVVMNHRTAPDVPVAWAVRMSMSIPFVWREVIWQKGWGAYQGRSLTGHKFVDGGMLSNFPIRLIDTRVPDIMGDTDPDGALNLGLLLDENLPIAGFEDTKPAALADHLKVVQRVSRMMDTMMKAQDNREIREYASEVCRLPVKGVGTTEFEMADDKLKALVDGGNTAMIAHLDSRSL